MLHRHDRKLLSAALVVGAVSLATAQERATVQVGEGWGRIERGAVSFLWQRGRGGRIVRGSQVFDPYPDEFTVHDTGWKRAFYKSASGRARAESAPAKPEDGGCGLVVGDETEHFMYRQRVELPAPDTVRIVYEYMNRDLADARLQLGSRPSVLWISGARYRVTTGGKTVAGQLSGEYGGRRILWGDITEAEFSKVPFGTMILRSTRPMTLYDYRKTHQFWLGWDQPLERGKLYRSTVTIAFKPFAADVGGVRMRDLEWDREVRDGTFRIRLRLTRVPPDGPKRLQARLQIWPAAADIKRVAPTVAQEQTIPLSVASRTAQFAGPVIEPGRFTARLRLTVPATGETVLDLNPLRFEVRPMFVFYSALSLYTDEPEVVFPLRLEAGAGDPTRLRVRLEDTQGRVLLPERTMGGVDLELRLPRADFEDGLHTVAAAVFRGGQLVGRARARFRTAPPVPWAVKIDHRTRGLIVDGRPFFPFGFYVHKGRFYDDSRGPQYVLNLEAPYKFNLVCPYHNFGLDFRKKTRPTIEKFLDRADAVGLKMHYDIRKMCCAQPSPALTAAVEDEVRHFRSAPALLCWYLADEPAGQRIPPDRFLDLYPRIAAADPYHPTTMVFCIPSKAHEYKDALDIVMVDPYPVPNQPLTRVAETVDLVRNAFPPGTPIWCVPQAFGGGEGWGREPTPEEARCMTYLAILHGATGIQYFIRRPPMNNPFTGALWGEIRRMACEVRELTPVLLSLEPRPTAVVDTATGSVEAAAWRLGGRVWVLCVNTRNRPTEFSVRCPALKPAAGRAEVLFRDRSVALDAEGGIHDWIDGYGVRVYAFAEQKAPVLRTPQQEPRAGGILNNGDFERQTNVGYPDFFRYGQGADTAASWGTDSTVVHTGRHSLFIRSPSAASPGPSVVSFPMVLGRGKYRVALFARADRTDLPLRVGVGEGLQPVTRDFGVGKQWQEFVLDFDGPEKRRRVHLRFEPKQRGTVWIDTVRVKAFDDGP
ncbi:MAG: hypothetical protein GXP31_02825 [Kiritimatiellaeota bacterium]|nr:hypothetical protein [Kiritimatiellota bacterium]